jgi:hypothetical protein
MERKSILRYPPPHPPLKKVGHKPRVKLSQWAEGRKMKAWVRV